MKHRTDPLTTIDDVRRRLGAPRVNITVLWAVVTQLASDNRWLQAELDTIRADLRYLRESVNGPEETYYVAPVGGSDSAEPSSKPELGDQLCLPYDA